jgi:putative FmdB family regulatory protein
MPTYEYECEKCGKKFDLFQSMKDDPIKKCPDCKGKVHRLLGGGSGIIFKGSGFYETDYKKKPAPSCDKAGSEGCSGCSIKKGKKD